MIDERDHWHVFESAEGWVAQYRSHAAGVLPSQHGPFTTKKEADQFVTEAVTGNVREHLEYLRGEIRAERISYGEIAELQGLAEFIDPFDVELLEWAGVTEEEARAKQDAVTGRGDA